MHAYVCKRAYRACVCVCMNVFMNVCACIYVCVCVCVCVQESMRLHIARVCMYAYMRACIYATQRGAFLDVGMQDPHIYLHA